MKTEIMNNVTRTLYKAKFNIKKHSPEILIVTGIAGTVTSAVLACKATLKLRDVLDESKETIDKIHEVSNDQNYKEKYSKEDAKKDLSITYIQTGVKIAKLYAPAVILCGLSLTAIISSNNILHKRNIALAAAYTAIDKGFKEYRGRVIERFGKEMDRELRFNLKSKEIEETVVDENGKEKKEKKTVTVADCKIPSDYAKFFDDGNIGWDKNPELSLFFLKQQQEWANKLLKERGHLFLNEVYDSLGIPRTMAGNIVGWIYDEKNPIGDNYVDFGLYDYDNERVRAFINGQERVILLDFNVDGNILELIE